MTILDTNLLFFHLQSILSTLPRGNYVVYDEEIRVFAIAGEDISKRGVVTADVLGKTLGDMNPASVELWESKILAALQGETFETVHKFGEDHYQIRISPLVFPNETSKFVLFFSMNITEHKKALEELEFLQRKKTDVVDYEESLHREIVKIFNWRQEIEGKGNNKTWMEQALPNLNTSLMQGSGLGALVTTVGSLIRKAKKEGDAYTVPAFAMELLEENFASTKKLVKTLAEAQTVFESLNKEPEVLTLLDVLSLIREEVNYLHDMLQIKNQSVMISNLQNGYEMKISCLRHSLQVSIRELFINAMKYAPDGASIYVLFLRTGDTISVKFLNPPMDASINQFDFTKSEESVLFQPFYRVNKYVDERFLKEEFGLGLGLPVVKKLLEDMGAKVYFQVGKSNLYGGKSEEVSVSLEFKLVS
ncbi:ATP-binding protein [Leptospira sp. 96542]|nr:ATP-binding protein [Leptospira sp. 96542]